MRYDADHKARTRAAVLKEASRALREDGPDKLAVANLMSRAGLTHGGFYAHFASKDDLVAKAVAEAFRNGARLFERTTKDLPPRAALAAYLAAYLSPVHRDSRARGCPLPALAGDLARLPPAARENFAAGIALLAAKIATLLTAAGYAEAEPLASSVMAEMVGAVALSRAIPGAEQATTLLARSHAMLLHRLALETAAP